MVKVILQAMPSYIMSVFKLSVLTSRRLEKMIKNFWWAQGVNKKKINWIAWKKLAKKKESGGLEFRELELFNKALLAKQCWRLLQNPSLLSSKLFKSIYFPHCSLMKAKNGYRPSRLWNNLLEGREVIEKSSR